MKVAYNTCFGGFGLSEIAMRKLKELGVDMSEEEIKYGYCKLPRHDSRLIRIIEELGEKASGSSAKVIITNITETKYRITDFDGKEKVIEYPRSYDDYDWIETKE